MRRRILHMDMLHTWEERSSVLTDFLQKMTDSGYNHKSRVEVIKSATTKYYRQVLIQETGGKRLYQSHEDMAESRRLKSLINKTWYKPRRGGVKLMPSKDLPWHSQEKEDILRK